MNIYLMSVDLLQLLLLLSELQLWRRFCYPADIVIVIVIVVVVVVLVVAVMNGDLSKIVMSYDPPSALPRYMPWLAKGMFGLGFSSGETYGLFYWITASSFRAGQYSGGMTGGFDDMGRENDEKSCVILI